MSPRDEGPSLEARFFVEGLPRTSLFAPSTMIVGGAIATALGALMLRLSPERGEYDAVSAAVHYGGAWSGIVAGPVMIAAALLLRRRRAALRKALAWNDADAWTLDHRWTPGLARDRAPYAAAEAAAWVACALVLGVAGAGLVLLPGPLVKLTGLLVVAIATVAAYHCGGALRRGLLFGEAILRWDGGGPLRLGAEWRGAVEVGGTLRFPRARLRYVEEEKVYDDEGGASYEPRERAGVELTAKLERGADGRNRIVLSGLIPADAKPTRLTDRPARYWELVAQDDASRWATVFLVPVYA